MTAQEWLDAEKAKRVAVDDAVTKNKPVDQVADVGDGTDVKEVRLVLVGGELRVRLYPELTEADVGRLRDVLLEWFPKQ